MAFCSHSARCFNAQDATTQVPDQIFHHLAVLELHKTRRSKDSDALHIFVRSGQIKTKRDPSDTFTIYSLIIPQSMCLSCMKIVNRRILRL